MLVRGERPKRSSAGRVQSALEGKKYRHKQGVDDKHSGEILPVEVKKSSRKWERDVCPKHIYLLEKKIRFRVKASCRDFFSMK